YWGAGAKCLAEQVDVSALLERAEEHEDEDRYAEAEAIYNQILADYPGSNYALGAQEGLVILYFEWGRREPSKKVEADSAYEELLTKFSEHEGLAKAVDHIADRYRQRKRYKEARQLYQYIVDTWPDAEHAAESQRGVALTSMLLGDDPNAEAAIERLLTEFGEQEGVVKAIDRLADVCRTLGKYEKAQELYQHIVDNWPEAEHAAEAQSGVIRSKIGLGDEEGAQAAIGKLLSDFSGNKNIASAVFDVAENYAWRQKNEKALELYKYVVEHWPKAASAMQSQTSTAKIYIGLGDDPNAKAATNKLLADFSGDEDIAKSVEVLAKEYSQSGKQEEATRLYKYMLERWPEGERAVWAQMGLVASRIRSWNLDGAETELGNLLSRFSAHEDLPAAVHEIVEEYRNTGAHEEGRGLFAYLLENWDESDSTMLELRVGVALQSIKLGEPNKADAAVQRLIADYNDHANLAKALFQIGEEYLYAKNYEEAITLWELILNNYSGSQFKYKSETPYFLGLCYEKLEKPAKAIEYYKLMLKTAPDDRFTKRLPYRLGLLYRSTGEPAEAVHWFGQQRQLYSNEVYNERALLHKAAVYYYDLKDYKKGAQVYQQYINEYPDRKRASVAYLFLARCCEKMGDRKRAVTVLEEALGKFGGTNRGEEIAEELKKMQEGGTT
ncbi:MAG: tetratricopeptide repeat protein, partial [Planctomycetota bacterium]